LVKSHHLIIFCLFCLTLLSSFVGWCVELSGFAERRVSLNRKKTYVYETSCVRSCSCCIESFLKASIIYKVFRAAY
jgi:hypothetical protein